MAETKSMSSPSTVQVVDFINGNDEYAIEIQYIIEIISFRDPATVPGSPEFVEGVVDLRGQVIPVINLKKRLGKKREIDSKPGHILIIKLKDMLIGICVEKVLEVTHIPIEKIQSTQDILKGGDVNYVKGFCKVSNRLLLLLDVTLILSDQEKELLNRG
ncbi:MAG TPA: chemotaxis protein CheW [Nitrospiria bacterium]|jgi:purine-binding chemotaxis protein CheW